MVSKETRAWTIPEGWRAPQAARVISNSKTKKPTIRFKINKNEHWKQCSGISVGGININ